MCDPLKEFLNLHHKNLTLLELDFIDWIQTEYCLDDFDDGSANGSEASDSDEEEFKYRWTPLADLVLPDRGDPYEEFLPNLQALSISQASFKGTFDFLIYGLNLPAITQLRLINCKRAAEFLTYIAETEQPLQVTKLELVIRHNPKFSKLLGDVNFLRPFEGLKDLFLLLDSTIDDVFFTAMISRHVHTLRRLVYHRRSFCMTQGSPYFEEYCDRPMDEVKYLWIPRILEVSKIESFGIHDSPAEYESMGGFNDSSLKLFHLRFTGTPTYKPRFFDEFMLEESSGVCTPVSDSPDKSTPPPCSPNAKDIRYDDWEQISSDDWRKIERKEQETFADWAFASKGFPRLQVLAIGDFSYGDRFADSQLLWVRDSNGSESGRPWRNLTPDDIAENELVAANMDMLSACPVSPLFYECGDKQIFPGVS